MRLSISVDCPLRSVLQLLALLLFCVSSPALGAQLPAVRSPRLVSSSSARRSSSSVAYISRPDASDDKRVLASRLLRTAASHKRHSLHDVLAHAPDRSPAAPTGTVETGTMNTSLQVQLKKPIVVHTTETKILHAIVTHLYPSGQNSTEDFVPPLSIAIEVQVPPEAQSESFTSEETPQPRSERPSSERHEATPSPKPSASPSAASEEELLRQSVAALRNRSPSRLTAALRTLEELCHSIHYGRALQSSGGFTPVLEALSSRHRPVRAAAAWAVATCCQNNPPVQRAALQAGAVPTLARLAWRDVLTVRARALFALNAVLGMEEARLAFESLPFATQVVTAALHDGRDFRATRRALNLVELLVRRNLDAWKTQLEAWDVPSLVERLMREHSDIDVRESAARIIAALDGRIIA